MPIDVTTFSTKLSAPLTSGGVELSLVDGTDVVEEVSANAKIVFLQIFTAARSEIVAVYENLKGDVAMSRGMDGTSAQPWPCDACVTAIRVVDGPMCEDSEGKETGSESPTPLTFKGEGCVEIHVSDDNLVTVSLTKTGIGAGEYGGLVVDECGRIKSVAQGWPNTIAYDPCPCG